MSFEEEPQEGMIVLFVVELQSINLMIECGTARRVAVMKEEPDLS